MNEVGFEQGMKESEVTDGESSKSTKEEDVVEAGTSKSEIERPR